MLRHLTAFVRIGIFIIVLWGHSLKITAMSPQTAHIYTSLDSIETIPLLDIGSRAIGEGDNERAAIALYIVTQRYQANPNDSLLCKCAVVAYRNLGNLYSTHSLDYRQAYRYLYKALKIAQETHNDYQLAYIHTSLANLYNADKFTNTLPDHKNCK
ncbi:MAG: hypothetical protein K2K26_09055, partial [Muribaculaceae bacterium]|nr:hypothetical protein [Muribaculaceae bacterium]